MNDHSSACVRDSQVFPSRASGDAGQPSKLRAERLSKRYGDFTALDELDLEVRNGELLTLLGASGSGKTTLLQVISGLVAPSTGRLLIDGTDITHTPPHRRDIGVVFQNYALFPHLSVAENVAFPLQMRKLPAAQLQKRMRDALEMVGLGPLEKRFPHELSGGQQQRVALARCFVYRPSLILMDEPLSALDRKLRESMQIEIKRLHRESGATIVFVTHDQEEALALSDRIALMSEARIVQIGTPQAIYETPSCSRVAEFIGLSNLLKGEIVAGHRLQTSEGTFTMPSQAGARAGGSGALMIRPEHMQLLPHGQGLVQAQVIETVYTGADTRVLLKTAGGMTLTARQAAGTTPLQVGEPASLAWQPDNSHFLAD